MDEHDLIAILADGEFHSGERLGEQAGLTRAAVWKQVRKLEKWGLNVEASSGRGYRLSQPIELLNADRIRAELRLSDHLDLDRIDVFTRTDSTNRYLLENPPSRTSALCLCLAEWQSAGRGRLERRWESPLGSGICLSAGWTWAGIPRNYSALSLAAGATIAAAIADSCGIDVQLKWPNDIVWDNRKLGGILVESRIEAQGDCQVVIGAGINFSVPDDLLRQVSDWSSGAVDLRTATDGALPDRNVLAGRIAARLGELLAGFDDSDMNVWLQTWRRLDHLYGKLVRVGSGANAFEGRADGIDDDGALRVIQESGMMQRVVAGDASVRAR